MFALAQEEGVARPAAIARGWSGHLEPARLAVVRAVPGVGDSDRNQAAGRRLEPDRAAVEDQDRLTLQHVEALLEGMQMELGPATRVDRAQAEASGHRSR